MSLIAILENPNYLINIGNAIRNVNGLGVDALYVIDGLNRLEDDFELLRKRKSLLKHSSGAVQFTQVKRFDTSEECLAILAADGFTSVATSPDTPFGNNVLLHESDLRFPKLAIWFGDEAKGLSKTVLNACALCLTIEMKGQVESFSLGTTTGIVLFEAVRQRKNFGR